MADKTEKLVILRGTVSNGRARFDLNDASSRFEVVFNPSEYQISKRSEFAEIAIPGLDSPAFQFSRGHARTLRFELVLDTYSYGDHSDVRDTYLRKLESFLKVDGELHAPPPCKVIWPSLEFVGIFESIEKRYVLFLDDGTPVRARVQVALREYIPIEVQLEDTPRSSPDRRKIHTIQAGDSLWQIAHEAYGDTSLWREIARANDIDDPRHLESGQRIVIPPLATPKSPYARRREVDRARH